MDRLADINVLLALLDPAHRLHSKVSRWYDDLPSGGRLLICRVAQMGLIRLLTSSTVMQGNPLTLRESWGLYGRFISDPSIVFVSEPPGLERQWVRYCLPFRDSPKIVADAYLAAFASVAELRLVSLDKGFHQFAGLDFEQIS